MDVNTIIQGDCLEVMRGMDDNSVDLVLTDPPYGILGGAKQIGGAGEICEATVYPEMDWDYEPFDLAQFQACQWVSKNQIVFGYNHFSDIFPPTKGVIVWDKKCQNGWDDTFSDGEIAWTSFNRPLKIFRHLWMGALKARREKRYHPTQKPLEVMKWIIENYSKEGDLILDPFAGSGSTLAACEIMGRRYIGIEISAEYCKIARKRVQEAKDSMGLFK